MRRLAAPPEPIYLLGFKPKDLKHNGKFHPLTVKVNTNQKLTVQARLGYFAKK